MKNSEGRKEKADLCLVRASKGAMKQRVKDSWGCGRECGWSEGRRRPSSGGRHATEQSRSDCWDRKELNNRETRQTDEQDSEQQRERRKRSKANGTFCHQKVNVFLEELQFASHELARCLKRKRKENESEEERRM
jgi:hypothetical protein